MNLKFGKEAHIINLTETVKASTCKAVAYKAVWVVNGKCLDKRPVNFDLIQNKIYIVGVGGIEGIIFPKIKDFKDLPPEPNYEYNSVEILDSLLSLAHCIKTKQLDKQIDATIKWCEKFGFPFFGNDGFGCGDISTCYKDTGKVGFNYMTLFHDLNHLSYVMTEILCCHQEDAVLDALKISMLKKQEKYLFINHNLTCEIGFKTLISLAYYQLSYILMLPNGAEVKHCKQCGAILITTNTKKLYCSKHSPQSHYAQKQRLKNKTITEQM